MWRMLELVGSVDSQELGDRIDNRGGVVRRGQGVCCWKKVER